MGKAAEDGVTENPGGEIQPSKTKAAVPPLVINDLTEEAAKRAWETYKAAVGGKSAISGEPLPEWSALVVDERMKLIVGAWRLVANSLGTFWFDKFWANQPPVDPNSPQPASAPVLPGSPPV
jgi:hypothetical protein